MSGGLYTQLPDGSRVPLSAADLAQRAADAAPKPVDMPVPDISDAQFGQGLWQDGVIAYAECMAFVQVGQLPDTLERLLAGLPDDGDPNSVTPRKVARADLAGRRLFQFAHPLVEILRELMEAADPIWTPEHLRARWAVWATL